MSAKLKLIAEMEDGTEYEATADQRDFARFEAQPFAGSLETHGATFLRFAAFSALDRVGALKNKGRAMGWEAFNNACVEVRVPNDEENLEE